MGSISIRKLDDEIIAQLRIQAAKHGVSMEEEARQILKQAVFPDEKIGNLALSLFGKSGGVELELPKHTHHEPINFEE